MQDDTKAFIEKPYILVDHEVMYPILNGTALNGG